MERGYSTQRAAAVPAGSGAAPPVKAKPAEPAAPAAPAEPAAPAAAAGVPESNVPPGVLALQKREAFPQLPGFRGPWHTPYWAASGEPWIFPPKNTGSSFGFHPQGMFRGHSLYGSISFRNNMVLKVKL